MGTTRASLPVYSSTVYSEGIFAPDARARPSEADFLQAGAYWNLLRKDPPAQATDNRWRQVDKYRSVPYIAIQRIMSLVGGAHYDLLVKKPPTFRTTFGPGNSVAKATPTGTQHGRDEDYLPFDGDDDHPLAKLCREPNPNESMGEMVAKVVLQNRLTGVGPVWAVPNEFGKPVECWPLKTPFMYPLFQMNAQYPNGAWRVNPYRSPGWMGVLPTGLGSGGALIPGEDVKRFLDPHPVLDWDGWSAITAGATNLDTFESVEVARKSSLDNGLQLQTVITVPGANPDQADRLRQSLMDKNGGVTNAFKPLVITTPITGDADKPTVTTVSTTPDKMAFESGWVQNRDFILALFGVPPSIAGFLEDSTYANSYAAQQQFYNLQENYLHRLSVWFTRCFCRPWSSFPGEFVLNIKPKPIDDKDLKEKQHARQCQVGTITLNESRAKDDMPPLPYGGDLLPVALAKQQQAAMPQPDAAGEMPGDESAPPEESQDDGADVPDEMVSAALEELGVPDDGGVQKGVRREGETWQTNGRWWTLKNGRTVPAKGPGAKPAAGGKTNTALASAQAAEYQRLRDRGLSHGDAQQQSQEVRPGSAPDQDGRGTRVQQVSQRAKASPAVKEQLARAHEWADRMAEMHADRVAKHLGIDRASAKHVLASTIKMLCERALRGEGDEQTKEYSGAQGQTLKIGVKRKQIPGGGGNGPPAQPRPANPAGEGSLPPLPKAMSTQVDSDDGCLVPPAMGRMRRRVKLRRVLKKALEGLEQRG